MLKISCIPLFRFAINSIASWPAQHETLRRDLHWSCGGDGSLSAKSSGAQIGAFAKWRRRRWLIVPDSPYPIRAAHVRRAHRPFSRFIDGHLACSAGPVGPARPQLRPSEVLLCLRSLRGCKAAKLDDIGRPAKQRANTLLEH